MTLETPIQLAIQETIRSIEGFKNGRVTINDWSPFDFTAHTDNVLVVVMNADNWRSDQTGMTPQNRFDAQVDLLVPYQTTEEETYNLFRDKRDLFISKFNEASAARSPGGVSVTCNTMRSDGEIQPYYDVYISAEDVSEAIPLYYGQTIVLEVETF